MKPQPTILSRSDRLCRPALGACTGRPPPRTRALTPTASQRAPAAAFALGGALLLAATLLLSAPAHACLHVMRERVDPEMEMLRVAERHLARHRYRLAARQVLRVYPDIRGRKLAAVAARASAKTPGGGGAGIEQVLFGGPRPSSAHRLRTAQLIMATAVVRTDGALGLRHGWSGATLGQRRADLTWAVEVLRARVSRAGSNAVERTRLGEALSRLETTRGEAHTILAELARGKVITDPMAWAALADLRADAGDRGGSRAALAACRRLSGSKKMCGRYMNKRHLQVAAWQPEARR